LFYSARFPFFSLFSSVSFYLLSLSFDSFLQDRVDYPIELMTYPAARASIDMIGYHGYGGSVTAQDAFHARFPDVPILFTEFTQVGNEGNASDFADRLFGFFEHIYYDTITHHSRTSQHWSVFSYLSPSSSFSPLFLVFSYRLLLFPSLSVFLLF